MATKGVYVVGEVLGYSEEPWETANGKSGINRQLAVIVNEYTDRFDQQQKSVQIIDVPQESATSVAVDAEKLKGQLVQVRVGFRARVGGRDGAWLACYMPKDSVLQQVK